MKNSLNRAMKIFMTKLEFIARNRIVYDIELTFWVELVTNLLLISGYLNHYKPVRTTFRNCLQFSVLLQYMSTVVN